MMTTERPYKKRLIILAAMVALLLVIICLLPLYPRVFSSYIFLPFQSLRNTIFGNVPFSLGDLLYIVAGISLVILILKWIFFIFSIKAYKHSLATSFLRTASTACIIYIIFLLGWGSNYYKPSLSDSWQLNDSTQGDTAFIAFDRFLIEKLNTYANHYHPMSFKEVGARSMQYYHSCTRHSEKVNGLKIKPSLFGNLMQYMGVQGYYNPITGEAQVNSYLPDFMLPFVICHELAHQSGVAAEDDANLMAYVINTKAPDSSFNYSGYFNLWLYAHSRVKMEDTVLARSLYNTLNPVSVAHLDTLRAINKRYRSKLSRYSNGWYDKYLRMQHVERGIESYDDVVQTAWIWEQQAASRKDSLIVIP